jgi:hypothetical protein
MIPHMEGPLDVVRIRAVKKFGAVVLFALLACGKRGDPHPPVPMIPQATSDLVVAQRGAKVLLSWSYPSMTTAGKSLGTIRRVMLYRAAEEPPTAEPQAAPSPIDSAIPQPITLFAKIPPLSPTQFNKRKEQADVIETAALAGATSGAKLAYEDAPLMHAADGRPVRLDYAVVTEGTSARSDFSNIASIVPLDVALPPADLVATPKPEGIVLTWTAPAQTISGAPKPRVAGYNVYRVAPGELPADNATPLNASLVMTPTYTDIPPYGEHQYHVSAVAWQHIESDPSAAAKVTYKDLLPPPTPAGLTALVEPKAVNLVWEAVEAPDLAGYKLYRTEGTGIEQLKPVATIPLTPQPITALTFRDTTINNGISYYYEVAAVDKNGNESKRAKTDWVLSPKTP